MENTEKDQQEAVKQIYQFAANLMVNQGKGTYETKKALIEQGLDEESAATVVNNLENQIEDSKREAANKDMIFGAMWFIGGVVATAANIGFIFWGAIVFGAIQFFKGLMNR